MKNTREYIVPVFEQEIAGCWLECEPSPFQSRVTEHRMKHYIIERKIQNIYRKIHNVRSLGKNPNSIVLSELDYAFINAFYKYNPNFFIAFQANQVKGPYMLFGLKIIISNNKHPIVCWEP